MSLSAWQHTEKMTAIYLRGTGHVLAALTQLGNPDAALTAKDLVGNGLPLQWPRSLIVDDLTAYKSLVVPTARLATASVDFEAQALTSPRAFRVLGDPGAQTLASAGGGIISDASIAGDVLTVAWSPPPRHSRLDWTVVIDGPLGRYTNSSVEVVEDIPPAGMDILGVALTDPGDYPIMVAVKGYALYYAVLAVT